MRSSEKDNQIRIPAISTFWIEGGKLIEGWGLYDSGDAVEQLKA
jgi:hypothetical protein